MMGVGQLVNIISNVLKYKNSNISALKMLLERYPLILKLFFMIPLCCFLKTPPAIHILTSPTHPIFVCGRWTMRRDDRKGERKFINLM